MISSNRNFIICDKISSGTFSNVYKIKYKNEDCILKEENKKMYSLKNEINIYIQLININNIAKLLDYFIINENRMMILKYYELDLFSYRIKNFENNSYRKKIYSFIRIILDTLSYVHNQGIIHRDIKPKNICIDKNNSPVIIDFGLSKRYIENNIHINNNKTKSIIGSYPFISKNILELNEPSRRDDIISLFYTLIFMLIPSNILSSFCGSNIDETYLKKNIAIEADCLFKILANLNNLSFYQKPNYIDIVSLLP
tara:strand:+ start:42 stop:806 length:765 start_codon:yes stop_codon:yes gene_type:complete